MDNDWLNADELINEYRTSLLGLEKIRDKYKPNYVFLKYKMVELKKVGEKLSLEQKECYSFLKNELGIINSMISEIYYAIEWLETAREPGLKRGISNRSRYQRTALVDDIERLSYLVNIEQENQREATEDEIERITAMLNNLSDKERAAYLAVKGQNHSFSEAAEILGVSKSTVQSYVDRAQQKIDKQIQYGSQNMLFDFLPYENHL